MFEIVNCECVLVSGTQGSKNRFLESPTQWGFLGLGVLLGFLDNQEK